MPKQGLCLVSQGQDERKVGTHESAAQMRNKNT